MRAFLLALALCASCATESGFRARAQRRVGQSVDDVIRDLGPPAQERVLDDGHRLLVWTWIGKTRASREYDGDVVSRTDSCTLQFEAAEGRIVAFRYSGRCRG